MLCFFLFFFFFLIKKLYTYGKGSGGFCIKYNTALLSREKGALCNSVVCLASFANRSQVLPIYKTGNILHSTIYTLRNIWCSFYLGFTQCVIHCIVYTVHPVFFIFNGSTELYFKLVSHNMNCATLMTGGGGGECRSFWVPVFPPLLYKHPTKYLSQTTNVIFWYVTINPMRTNYQKLVRWFSMPPDERDTKDLQTFLEKNGMSESDLVKYQSDPNFFSDIQEESISWAKSKFPELVHKLYKRAMNSKTSTSDVRLFKDLVYEYDKLNKEEQPSNVFLFNLDEERKQKILERTAKKYIDRPKS